ncbi:hypothetical protein OH492_18940 [Vibrio chagasii]|nr:hypothetical protein [Vibrio chagasii]
MKWCNDRLWYRDKDAGYSYTPALAPRAGGYGAELRLQATDRFKRYFPVFQPTKALMLTVILETGKTIEIETQVKILSTSRFQRQRRRRRKLNQNENPCDTAMLRCLVFIWNTYWRISENSVTLGQEPSGSVVIMTAVFDASIERIQVLETAAEIHRWRPRPK